LCESAAQCSGRHEVDERLLAVDLDDREQLAVAGFEVGIAVDQDLLQLEAELVPERPDSLLCALAQMTARGPVEAD